MANASKSGAVDVASIANRVLAAWKSGQDGVCSRELARAQQLAKNLHASLTFESERVEVLIGAIQCLDGHRPEQVQAAIHLLKHLAGAGKRR
jgi:hypothetical protein